MASLITKIFIAALAAGSAQALPAIDVRATNSTPTPAPAAPDFSALIADLKTESTAINRFKKLLLDDNKAILTGDALAEKIVFDFDKKKAAAAGSKGGDVAAANIATFPILTDLGISTTVAFLNPCGMNTPHVHPRATEFLTVTEGAIDFGMILENGLVASGNQEIAGKLSTYQGTVFPMGAIHYQFNNNCDPATFVATLNNEDPGTSQIAQNFFGLNSEVVNVTLGYPKSIDGKNIEDFRKQIPVNLAQAIDTCVATCKKEGKWSM